MQNVTFVSKSELSKDNFESSNATQIQFHRRAEVIKMIEEAELEVTDMSQKADKYSKFHNKKSRVTMSMK